MSLTITQTQHIELIEQTLKLRSIQSSIQSRLNEIVQAMKSSNAFASAQKDTILDWELNFSLKDFEDLNSNENRFNLCMAICYLIKIVKESICDENDEKKLLLLSTLYEKLENILSMVLPEGETVDGIIETYDQFPVGYAELMNQLEAINISLKKQNEITENNAERVNLERNKKTIVTKNKLKALTKEHFLKTEVLFKKINELSSQVLQSENAINDRAQAIEKLHDEIIAEEQEYSKHLAECKSTINGL